MISQEKIKGSVIPFKKKRGSVLLHKDEIDKVFNVEEGDPLDQVDVLFKLYNKIPIFESLEEGERINAHVNEKTASYIMEKFIEYDQKINATRNPSERIFAGGLWMNCGFSVSEEVAEWNLKYSIKNKGEL